MVTENTGTMRDVIVRRIANNLAIAISFLSLRRFFSQKIGWKAFFFIYKQNLF